MHFRTLLILYSTFISSAFGLSCFECDGIPSNCPQRLTTGWHHEAAIEALCLVATDSTSGKLYKRLLVQDDDDCDPANADLYLNSEDVGSGKSLQIRCCKESFCNENWAKAAGTFAENFINEFNDEKSPLNELSEGFKNAPKSHANINYPFCTFICFSLQIFLLNE